MTRSPLVLAALASSAVPGLDPVAVESVAGHAGGQFDVAFVRDSQDRHWVVRAPVSAAASAQLELTVALLGLLSRRLPFAVPAPRGFAPLKDGGRAVVYPYLPGRPIDLAALPAGPGLGAEVGRSLAQLHNLDLALYEEAGLPAYDPESYRTRRLAELDRAAATGSVPSALLGRWERALEELTLWRFAPTPTHGALTGRHVLVSFDDEGDDADAAGGHVRAVTGWEHAQVADPADDFAGLVAYAPVGAQEAALEAYAHDRAERPDPHLRHRALLAGELAIVGGLLRALTTDQADVADLQTRRLHELQERVESGSAEALTAGDQPPPRATPTAPLPPGTDAGSQWSPAMDGSPATAGELGADDGTPAPHAGVDPATSTPTEVVRVLDPDGDAEDEPGYDLERPGADPSTQAHAGDRATAQAADRAASRSAGSAEPTELIDIAHLPRGASTEPDSTTGPVEHGG